LFYDESSKKLISSSNYISASQLAINSTTAPTENFYVNGTSRLNGVTKIKKLSVDNDTTAEVGYDINL
jgi:hypothetical protein